MRYKSHNDLNYQEINEWEFATYGEKICQWAKEYGDRVAVAEGENEITYQELKSKSFLIAEYFLELGIRKGDRIIVQLPNTISFIVSVFALFVVGAIPVMLLPAHRKKEISSIMKLAEPTAYITSDMDKSFDYKGMAEELTSHISGVKNLIYDSVITEMMNRTYTQELKVYEKPSYDDIAMLLLSGGTTGVPKLIPRTHGDYIYTNNMLAKRCELNEDSVFLAALPAPHNFPWGNPGILGTFSRGGKVVMAKSASPDEVFPLIQKHRVTFSALVPALVGMYLEVLEWDDSCDISSLEFIMVGGSVLEKNIARKIKTMMGCVLVNIYGMAEGLNCCTSLHDTEDVIIDTQGKAISEYDIIKIVDEEGNEVPSGEYGELITKGPYTLKGYYKLEEVNRVQFTKDGFFCSGDKARVRNDGNLEVVGRVREQINRAGEKITPSELEGYICEHSEISECVVVGIPDKILGQRICACIITDNEEMDLGKLREYLQNNGVTEYKLPDQLEIMLTWPFTAVGKIDKEKLVEYIKQKCE